MKSDMPQRVRDMYDCARAIRDLAPSTLEELRVDLRSQLALVRLIEIMGEAANHVEKDIQERHAAVPWRQIIATRNRVTHGYAGIDLDIMW